MTELTDYYKGPIPEDQKVRRPGPENPCFTPLQGLLDLTYNVADDNCE